MVSPLPQPLDPGAVTRVLVGGHWLSIAPGSFAIGTLRVGAGSSGEAIRSDIWFSGDLVEGGRISGPFSSLQALAH